MFFLKLSEVTEEMESLPFLSDWIISNSATVGEVLEEYINYLKLTNSKKFNLPLERYRLRLKKWRNPNKICLESQMLYDDVFYTTTNAEVNYFKFSFRLYAF